MSVAPQASGAPGARRAIRAVAGFDALVTGCLALPPLARLFVEALYAASTALGGGAGPAPAFAPVHQLFVQLAGILGVLWAGVRLAWPEPRLALADAAGRVVVAGVLLWWLAGGGLPEALVLFVATELGGAAWVLAALRRGTGGAVREIRMAVPSHRAE